MEIDSSARQRQLSQILEVLRTQSESLQRRGILHAFVFGSTARGEARADSDVDIVIDAAPHLGTPAVMEIEELLAEQFGRPVQIVTRAGLRPGRHDAILREMVEAF